MGSGDPEACPHDVHSKDFVDRTISPAPARLSGRDDFLFQSWWKFKDGTLGSQSSARPWVLEMRHPKLDAGLLAAGWEQLGLLTCVWLWVRPGRGRIGTSGLMAPQSNGHWEGSRVHQSLLVDRR